MRDLYVYVYGHPGFVLIMLLVMFVAYGVAGWFVCHCQKHRSAMKVLWKMLIWLEIITCLLLFFYAALFNRNVEKDIRYKLELFWSYKAVLKEVKLVRVSDAPLFFRYRFDIESRRRFFFYLRQILYNVVAFVPLGHAFYFETVGKHKGLAAFLTFFVISLGVELIQLVFHIGLFEFDDIFNNVLGGMTGFGVAALTQRMIERKKQADG